MFSLDQLKKNQPIALTGIFRHMALWLTSANGDVSYQNPKFQPTTSDQDNRIAIYFIHGTADRVSAFSLVSDRIIEKLPNAVSSIHLVSFNHRAKGESIETFSKELRDKILAKNDRRVVLIGHSRGGLVASYLAEFLAKEANIDVLSVMTIGTPFNGSDMAITPLGWLSTSVKQMEKNSEFLNRLNEKISESEIKYYHFAAQNDWLVSLNSTYVEENNHSLILLDRHGHLSILSSHRLVEYLQDCLLEVIQRVSSSDEMSETTIASHFSVIIAALCQQISKEIDALRARHHLNQTVDKEFVLIKLKEILNEINLDPNSHYPNANTLGDVINLYLEDKNIYPGTTPLRILSQHLNFPLTLFASKKSLSHLFIESIIDEYKDIPLPKTNRRTLQG